MPRLTAHKARKFLQLPVEKVSTKVCYHLDTRVLSPDKPSKHLTEKRAKGAGRNLTTMIGSKPCCALFAGVLLALVSAAPAQTAIAPATTCSNASIKGIYGLLITGYDSSGLYQMGMGQINANGTGSFTGVESVSDDGVIFNNQSLTGTYSLSSNCTGSGTIKNIKNGTTSHYNFVVDPVANQVEAAGTDSGHGTASGYALSQGAATCSTAGVAGTYGFHGGGDLVGSGVLQFDGQYVLDGTGKLSGVETRIVGGTVISAAAITGTYTMASTCRGTITYTFSGSTVHLNTVMVSGGKSFFTIETDTDTVSTSVAHQ